ncbi:hypothetical protein [Microbacterium aurugineum]|uniref:DUF5666 domain-containing protein n=1 Tax=Microbacterium aurugineum TaxID=2851642 RepID=A0ABY4IXX1_9MICO|nr:hypothetical protein [Microbacterium aurugineum]UPL17155.1 hypothetical protein KV397_04945 [Microbacterium aurugineum]
MVVVGALLTVIVAAVVGPTQPAVAADRVFLIDSLSHQGDDLSPGDGVCLTSTGVCTLRAALQESNASAVDDTIVIAPAEDVDASTPGVQPSGTIVVSGSGAAKLDARRSIVALRRRRSGVPGDPKRGHRLPEPVGSGVAQ